MTSQTSEPSVEPKRRIGLCLSGGGLRATFFHLGVIKALRELDLMDSITHVCSVSGGSILAAHLVLKWHEYNGSEQEFLEVSEEICDIGERDIRGRVVRRWLFSNALPILKLFPSWSLRTQLLEREYAQLYGEALLQDLSALKPGERPDVHLVTTSFKSGKLCSFSSRGFWVDHGSDIEPKLHPATLLPVSLAVAASSAFPPLFPPVEIERGRLAASKEDMPYDPELLTDGGVFDNLGYMKLLGLTVRRREEIDCIILSDASAEFDWDVKGHFSWIISRTSRAIDILMKRVADETLLKATSKLYGKEHIHVSISDYQDKLNPRPSYLLPIQIKKRLARIRTDLDYFSRDVVDLLARHGQEVSHTNLHHLSTSQGRSHPGRRTDIENGSLSSSRLLSIDKELDQSRVRKWGIFSRKDWTSYALSGWVLALIALALLPFWLERIDLNRRDQQLIAAETALVNAFKEGPKQLTSEYLRDFTALLSGLSLRYVKPEDLLMLGRSNDDPQASGYQLNTLPPRELWPNIRKTAQVLDEFAKRINAPVKIISAYRTPAYSQAIGGTNESTHILFNAVDFSVQDAGRASDWAKVLRQMRSEGWFTGGVGEYGNPGFIHLDTRPPNRDWGT